MISVYWLVSLIYELISIPTSEVPNRFSFQSLNSGFSSFPDIIGLGSKLLHIIISSVLFSWIQIFETGFGSVLGFCLLSAKLETRYQKIYGTRKDGF